MAKDNDLIYGVYDRTRGVGGCDDYFGYFKKESDARTEMKAQFEHLKTKNPTFQHQNYEKNVAKIVSKLIKMLPKKYHAWVYSKVRRLIRIFKMAITLFYC